MSLALYLWELACVAIGPQSGPGILCGEAENLGLLRSPFATQGRSHKDPRSGRFGLLEMFGRHQHLDALQVVDADGRPCGLIHRDALPVMALSPASQLPQVHHRL
ncbi:hypothetical protein TZ03_18420 [Pseudomonas sp. 10-1B]|uniref:hypothetical protein n=1 Tax=Pseudomonas sp. 10-1B TaxID=1546029 RepID=UPI00061FE147|nr:hypothetical protein TZ03_18420 [Pseudomonas sp. 10-1B]